MQFHRFCKLLRNCLLLLTFCLPYSAIALDLIKVKRQPLAEVKSIHDNEILRRALDETVQQFGEYQIEIVDVNMPSNRELKATAEGEFVNVTISPANQIWDDNLIAVDVPIRQGLLSYRLLLVNKVDLQKFRQVKTLDDLNRFSAGLLDGWKTTQIYKKHLLNMTLTHNFAGMFAMLNKRRFGYIPRAFYEVHDELETMSAELTDIVIEPTLALHIKTETFFYISPKHPKIAKRLKVGLRKLDQIGELKSITNKYFGGYLKQADLQNRTIINIENPYYNENN